MVLKCYLNLKWKDPHHNQFIFNILILLSYVILNVQKDNSSGPNDTSYIYREVGHWNNDERLQLQLDQIKFPNDYKNYRSICSEGCAFGYVKVRRQCEDCVQFY